MYIDHWLFPKWIKSITMADYGLQLDTSDADYLTNVGSYMVNPTNLNIPVSQYGALNVRTLDNGSGIVWTYQEFCPIDTSNRYYRRKINGASWSDLTFSSQKINKL